MTLSLISIKSVNNEQFINNISSNHTRSTIERFSRERILEELVALSLMSQPPERERNGNMKHNSLRTGTQN